MDRYSLAITGCDPRATDELNRALRSAWHLDATTDEEGADEDEDEDELTEEERERARAKRERTKRHYRINP